MIDYCSITIPIKLSFQLLTTVLTVLYVLFLSSFPPAIILIHRNQCHFDLRGHLDALFTKYINMFSLDLTRISIGHQTFVRYSLAVHIPRSPRCFNWDVAPAVWDPPWVIIDKHLEVFDTRPKYVCFAQLHCFYIRCAGKNNKVAAWRYRRALSICNSWWIQQQTVNCIVLAPTTARKWWRTDSKTYRCVSQLM